MKRYGKHEFIVALKTENKYNNYFFPVIYIYTDKETNISQCVCWKYIFKFNNNR